MGKLTDAEVVKALECCSKGRWVCEEECPRFKKGILKISDCRFELLEDALNLSNRQNAEIERLNNELVSADEVIGFQEAEIERLKEFEWMYNDLNK